MTRRIAISILLTVWLLLIVAGGLAYFVTRSMLVADLDATLLARVSSLPEIEPSNNLPLHSSDARDRYIIKNPEGQLEPPPAVQPDSVEVIPEPQIVNARFTTLPDGARIRTITVKTFARKTKPGAAPAPVTVIYSGAANQLDRLLERLLFSLGLFGLLAGVATAAVAVVVAKAALKPLRATADVIAAITEKNLNSRIDVHQLPSELTPVAIKLNELLARLETAFTQRKQFLADASHELRTPVAALVTTLEVTLAKERPAEDYARSLHACLEDARLLHHLVAALMDQVRAEHFATRTNAGEFAPVQISPVFDHCARIARTLTDPKNIHLHLQIPPGIVALTDELKLRSIVTNLLANAAEYTPARGEVTLTLILLPPPAATSAARQTIPTDIQATPQTLRITVHDTGPGIPPEHLPHLFEPFYRADASRTNANAHLGLGLFLVQAHAASLGGSCHATSAPAQGATFVVDIPAAVLAMDPCATNVKPEIEPVPEPTSATAP